MVLTPGLLARLATIDLGGLESDERGEGLRFEGPAGWPVRIAWREVSDELLRTFNVELEGHVKDTDLLAACTERSRYRPVGEPYCGCR